MIVVAGGIGRVGSVPLHGAWADSGAWDAGVTRLTRDG